MSNVGKSSDYPEHLNPFSEENLQKHNSRWKGFKRTLRKSFRIKHHEKKAPEPTTVEIRRRAGPGNQRTVTHYTPLVLPGLRSNERENKVRSLPESSENVAHGKNPFEDEDDTVSLASTLERDRPRRRKKRAPPPPSLINSLNDGILASNTSLASSESALTNFSISEPDEDTHEASQELRDITKDIEKLTDFTNNNVETETTKEETIYPKILITNDECSIEQHITEDGIKYEDILDKINRMRNEEENRERLKSAANNEVKRYLIEIKDNHDTNKDAEQINQEDQHNVPENGNINGDIKNNIPQKNSVVYENGVKNEENFDSSINADDSNVENMQTSQNTETETNNNIKKIESPVTKHIEFFEKTIPESSPIPKARKGKLKKSELLGTT